ncbi:hypothetical protein GGI04_003844, partial [Coemansia thaxteri]
MQTWVRGCCAASVIRQRVRVAGGFGMRGVCSMTANEVRTRFTEYFVKNGHRRLVSANIVPQNDKSLLFTNAGMVPFKQHFLDPSGAPHKMVTTVQKCVRAGGKHNDLDQVGYTARHHTFFEMLGNFSFGAYGKREAIHMAWKFVREELQLPVERLRVTVLEGDQETYEIWRSEVGVDERRIVRRGEDDNFWSMGAEGPCGPSTEIFWDTQDMRLAESDEERWLEFWNLVFMEYERGSDGALTPLATPCVDTGMGLERMASIMQGVSSNFETNEVAAVVNWVEDEGTPAEGQGNWLALARIVADHVRASAFLIAEGVEPSNTGRGYVLRRMIRRGVRAGRQLGAAPGVLARVAPRVEAAMGAAYPELAMARQRIIAVLEAEERLFQRTLGRGLAELAEIMARKEDGLNRVISGADAYALYDTHGFPLDLTQAVARDGGWTVDVAEFERLQRAGREQSKAARAEGDSGNDAGVVPENDYDLCAGFAPGTVAEAHSVHDTATPLLLAALRAVVGAGVMQAGLVVNARGIRFDFSGTGLSAAQILDVESRINAAALGGTQPERAVFPFHITRESAVAAGTRRIEAVAGVVGTVWLQRQLEHARTAAGALGAARIADLDRSAQGLVASERALRAEVDA